MREFGINFSRPHIPTIVSNEAWLLPVKFRIFREDTREYEDESFTTFTY